MTTHDDGTAAGREQIDLDRLIGELETEAARRQAAPDFPHDREAQLHAELERRSPHPAAAGAGEALAELETAVAALVDMLGTRPRRRRRQGERLVAAEGLAVVAALRAALERIASLEDRLGALRPPATGSEARAGASPPAASAHPDEALGGVALAAWRGGLARAVAAETGRVLYAGTDAGAVVAELRAAGVDAYGLETGGGEQPGPDVRRGGLLDHLRAVGDDGLGVAVVAGVPDAMAPEDLEPLVAELARSAAAVVLVSLAPWWWGARRGPLGADLATRRPFGPDTWLDAFHRRAMSGTAEYDAGGRSYRLLVRRP